MKNFGEPESEKLRAPHLSYNDIRQKAEAFLQKYLPAQVAPIPIETIIDNHLRLNIIPVPGIRENADVDGMLSRDGEEIWIEDSIYANNPHRYRFTLAHEVGHLILHGDIQGKIQYASFVDWKEHVPNQFENDQYRHFEAQTNSFAGLVLVPPSLLKSSFKKALSHATTKGLKLDLTSPLTQEYIASFIADDFDASSQVVAIRLEKDKLWEHGK